MHKLLLSCLFPIASFGMESANISTLLLPKGNILKPEVIAALINVQKELSKQKLGLKLWHYYKPQAGALKKRPHRYFIDVRKIDSQGNLQPLDIPRGYFTDSPVGGDDIEAYTISLKHVQNREIMYTLLKRYGFMQKEDNWEYKDSRGMRLCLLEQPVAWYGT